MALDPKQVININPNDYDNIYVVGDIHGELKRLNEIILKTRPRERDLMIFLGDYIDRGPESFECLRTVKELQEYSQWNFIPLIGNHENMMLSHCCEGKFNKVWWENGGKECYEQFKERIGDEEAIRNSDLLKWVKELPVLVKIGTNTYITHAGYDFKKDDLDQPLDEVLDSLEYDDFFWNRYQFFMEYSRQEQWFVGHTIVPTILPAHVYPWIKDNNVVMMDTGAFCKGGRLSCMEIKTGRVIQSSVNNSSAYEEW